MKPKGASVQTKLYIWTFKRFQSFLWCRLYSTFIPPSLPCSSMVIFMPKLTCLFTENLNTPSFLLVFQTAYLPVCSGGVMCLVSLLFFLFSFFPLVDFSKGVLNRSHVFLWLHCYISEVVLPQTLIFLCRVLSQQFCRPARTQLDLPAGFGLSFCHSREIISITNQPQVLMISVGLLQVCKA